MSTVINQVTEYRELYRFTPKEKKPQVATGDRVSKTKVEKRKICTLLRNQLGPSRSLQPFSGAFAKVRKTTISFVMSVCPSICPLGTTRLPMNGFHETWYLKVCWKAVETIQFSFESDKNNGYFTKIYFAFTIKSRWILLIMRKFSNKVVQKINTHAF
jgi:hypothetical protein